MDEIDPGIFRIMRPAMVCLCRHVSEERLKAEIRQGATTFKILQERTSCSTVCGTCEPKVRRILAAELALIDAEKKSADSSAGQ